MKGKDSQGHTSISARFARGWFGPELPEYREAEPTYGYFNYGFLPPLDERLDGSLAWLTPMDTAIRKELEPHWKSDRDRSRLHPNFERVVREAEKLGYVLPETFLRFMRSEELQQRIPSCTACYFDAPERVIEAPPPAAGILIRFMNDQQWCLLWYLYVERSGGHAIVAADRALDIDDDEDSEVAAEHQLVLCAPGFEEFLFRIWVENNIWFVLNENHRDLNPMERRYLAHYRR